MVDCRRGRLPCRRLRRISFASLSVGIPVNSLSAVESDSDNEWDSPWGVSQPNVLYPIASREAGGKLPGPGPSSTATSPSTKHKLSIQSLQNALAVLINHPQSDLVVKVLWLSVFNAAVPKQASRFEWMSILIPSTVSLISKIAKFPVATALPGPLPAVLGFLSKFTAPAAIILGAQLVCGILGIGRKQRRSRVTVNARQLQGQVNGNRAPVREVSPAALVRAVMEEKPSVAREYAAIYEPVLLQLRDILDWRQIQTSPRFFARFDATNAELMRYSAACGILEAKSNDSVDAALQNSVKGMQATLEWSKTFPFMSDKELKQNWNHLAVWTKRVQEGHPALLIRLGKGMRECEGEKAHRFAAAVITQVDRGVRKCLKNDGADQMIAVVDCEGARSYQVRKMLGLMKSIPTALNKHYPARLKTLYLINMPMMLRWVIKAIKPFLHPATRQKIMVYGTNVDALPTEIREVVRWETVARKPATAENNRGVLNGVTRDGEIRPTGMNVRHAADGASSSTQDGTGLLPPLSDGSEGQEERPYVDKDMYRATPQEPSTVSPLTTVCLLLICCVLTFFILKEMPMMEPDEKSFAETLDDDL